MSISDKYAQIAAMNKTELCNVIWEIYETLYLEEEGVNPDKEWTPDVLAELNNVLHRYKMTPEQTP